MKKAIYPGSFDPVTNGHLDVIQRAAKLCDNIVIAVAFNQEKACLFDVEERIALIKEATETEPKVTCVTSFEGLLVDFARAEGATAIVRGLRAISDFEFEFQMALINRKLAPEFETIFLMPTEEYTYLSSRIVREIARLQGDVSAFVTPEAANALLAKFSG